MKKVFALILAVMMVVCSMTVFAGNAQAADAEFELDVAISFGEPQIRNFVRIFNEIEETTEGRVKFNLYPSNSLVSIPEIPEALRDGIADMAVIPSVNYPSMLAYNAEVVGLPFIGILNPDMECDAWQALYDAFPELQEEWDKLNAHVFYHYTTPGYNCYFIDENVEARVPADLAGHKIMSGKIPWLNFISDQGGAGIQAAPTAYYENLEKGVSDGVVQSYATIRGFGCLELIHAGTEFGAEGSYYDMFFIAINQDVWNSFPEDIQQVFNDINKDSEATYSENVRVMEDYANALSEAPENVNIIRLEEEEVQVWKDALKPFNDAYMVEIQDTYQREKIYEMYDFVLNWVAENADNYK